MTKSAVITSEIQGERGNQIPKPYLNSNATIQAPTNSSTTTQKRKFLLFKQGFKRFEANFERKWRNGYFFKRRYESSFQVVL